MIFASICCQDVSRASLQRDAARADLRNRLALPRLELTDVARDLEIRGVLICLRLLLDRFRLCFGKRGRTPALRDFAENAYGSASDGRGNGNGCE